MRCKWNNYRVNRTVPKYNVSLNSKILDDICIKTGSVNEIQYIVLEDWENNAEKSNCTPINSFQLYTDFTNVDIHMKMHVLKKTFVFENQYIEQFSGVFVSNDTTDKALQQYPKTLKTCYYPRR